MKISEAVEKAMNAGAMIYRKSVRKEQGYRNTAIMPTNSYDTCILVTICEGKETGSCRNWNPTADDLMADDWELWGEFAQKITDESSFLSISHS